MKGLPSSVIEGIQIKPMGWLGDEGLIHLNSRSGAGGETLRCPACLTCQYGPAVLARAWQSN